MKPQHNAEASTWARSRTTIKQTHTHTHARRRLLKGLRYRRGLSEPWLWGQAPDSSAGSSRERPQEELNYRVPNYFGSNWLLVINRSKRRNSFPRCQGHSCRESPAAPLPARLQAGPGVRRGATAPCVSHGVCPKGKTRARRRGVLGLSH